MESKDNEAAMKIQALYRGHSARANTGEAAPAVSKALAVAPTKSAVNTLSSGEFAVSEIMANTLKTSEENERVPEVDEKGTAESGNSDERLWEMPKPEEPDRSEKWRVPNGLEAAADRFDHLDNEELFKISASLAGRKLVHLEDGTYRVEKLTKEDKIKINKEIEEKKKAGQGEGVSEETLQEATVYFSKEGISHLQGEDLVAYMKKTDKKLLPLLVTQTAAEDIQRVYRGHSFRNDLKKKKKNAVKIQKTYRGHLGRRRSIDMKQQLAGDGRLILSSGSNDERKNSQHDDAAKRIQARYRGFRDRKDDRSKLKKHKREKERACVTVQAHYRGYRQRKHGVKTKKREEYQAAWAIQRRYRLYRKEKQKKREREYVHMRAAQVQKVMRGFLARRFVQDMKNRAACVIQRTVTRYLDRLHEQRRRDAAALRIQSQFRAFRAVQKVQQLKTSLHTQAHNSIAYQYGKHFDSFVNYVTFLKVSHLAEAEQQPKERSMEFHQVRLLSRAQDEVRNISESVEERITREANKHRKKTLPKTSSPLKSFVEEIYPEGLVVSKVDYLKRNKDNLKRLGSTASMASSQPRTPVGARRSPKLSPSMQSVSPSVKMSPVMRPQASPKLVSPKIPGVAPSLSTMSFTTSLGEGESPEWMVRDKMIERRDKRADRRAQIYEAARQDGTLFRLLFPDESDSVNMDDVGNFKIDYYSPAVKQYRNTPLDPRGDNFGDGTGDNASTMAGSDAQKTTRTTVGGTSLISSADLANVLKTGSKNQTAHETTTEDLSPFRRASIASPLLDTVNTCQNCHTCPILYGEKDKPCFCCMMGPDTNRKHKAYPTCVEVLEIMMAESGSNHTAQISLDLLVMYNLFGLKYMDQNQYEKALGMFRKVLATTDYAVLSEHDKTELEAWALSNLAALFYQSRKYTVALEYAEHVVEFEKRLIAWNNSSTAMIHVGSVLSSQGKYEDSIAVTKHASHLATENLKVPHATNTTDRATNDDPVWVKATSLCTLTACYTNMFIDYVRLDNEREARQALDLALSIAHQVLRSEHPWVVLIESIAKGFQKWGCKIKTKNYGLQRIWPTYMPRCLFAPPKEGELYEVTYMEGMLGARGANPDHAPSPRSNPIDTPRGSDEGDAIMEREMQKQKAKGDGVKVGNMPPPSLTPAQPVFVSHRPHSAPAMGHEAPRRGAAEKSSATLGASTAMLSSRPSFDATTHKAELNTVPPQAWEGWNRLGGNDSTMWTDATVSNLRQGEFTWGPMPISHKKPTRAGFTDGDRAEFRGRSSPCILRGDYSDQSSGKSMFWGSPVVRPWSAAVRKRPESGRLSPGPGGAGAGMAMRPGSASPNLHSAMKGSSRPGSGGSVRAVSLRGVKTKRASGGASPSRPWSASPVLRVRNTIADATGQAEPPPYIPSSTLESVPEKRTTATRPKTAGARVGQQKPPRPTSAAPQRQQDGQGGLARARPKSAAAIKAKAPRAASASKKRPGSASLAPAPKSTPIEWDLDESVGLDPIDANKGVYNRPKSAMGLRLRV